MKRALAGTAVARHPTDERLSGIYGTILWEELGPLHQRNVTVFADGEVDRSPCGSGTSARLALLDRSDPLGAPALLGYASPAVAVVAAGAAGLMWRTGVRHYRSTGS